MLKKKATALLSKLPFVSSLAVLLFSLAVLVIEPPFTSGLRNASFDTFQRWHPREYQPAPVRIIDIDEESLKKLGQWPWPRTRLASMVDILTEMGVAVIVFDMVFAEPDRSSPAVLMQQWPDEPEIASLMEKLPDHDETFASSIKNGPVVMGFSLDNEASGNHPALKARFINSGKDPKLFLPPMEGAITNLKILETAAKGNGSFNFRSDFDGVLRHAPLLVRMKDKIYPSLSIEALRVFLNTKNVMVSSSKTGIASVRIGDISVKTDPHGEVWLHFSKFLEERYIPAWKLLEGKANPDLLKNHIVFFGTSAKGLLDLRFSPLGDMIPGVEVHVQLVEQLLQGTSLSYPEWSKAATILFLIGMWVLFLFLLPRIGVFQSVLLEAGAVGMVVYFSWYSFTRSGLFFDPLFPSLSLTGFFLAYIISRHLISEQERRWIKDAFSSYVSPNLVSYLMENPDQLSLGGETRECSFVLTDLTEFTALMEKSDPSKVASLLNDYLEEMVKITFKHNGTLDRFVGDAVAVMFSAPIVQRDSAARAVACAMEMDIFARDFAVAKQAEGFPFGNTRIGVHTGEVLVGNFGGKTMLDYRALGDPINTASRLESVNKHLGTQVCVSGVTAKKCPGFTGRPIGKLVLKGKSKDLETFEPLSREEADSQRVKDYMEAYQIMEKMDPQAPQKFKALSEKYPDDPLVIFHLKRLESGESGNTIVMREK